MSIMSNVKLNFFNSNIFEKMQDILVYLFPLADINTKNSLLLVNKELSKLRFKDFINDDVSQHIFNNKGYLNIELYIKIQDNINFIQEYDKNFSIKYSELNIYNAQLYSIDLTGLINLQNLTVVHNQLHSVDLTGLINLKTLIICNNPLTEECIENLRCINIQDLRI